MRDGIERGYAESSLGDWRIVAAAWLVAIIILALFAGVQALAARSNASPRETGLAGAVIPRHDPGSLGPDEMAASDWQERARVEASSCW
jgi:hypothetical protein